MKSHEDNPAVRLVVQEGEFPKILVVCQKDLAPFKCQTEYISILDTGCCVSNVIYLTACSAQSIYDERFDAFVRDQPHRSPINQRR